jgi:hypothetical protein
MKKQLKEQLSSILQDLTDVENEEDEWGNEDYEYENEPEECPNGFKWCSVKQMCVPIPDEGMDLDSKLPEIGGGVMEEAKLMEIIDSKIKECAQTNALMNYPDPKPAGMIKRLKKDIAGLEEIYHMLREKGEYRAFFQSVLKDKYGVSSPRELPDDKRKEFFQYVNSNWKSKEEEKVEAGVQDAGVQKALGIKEIKKELEGAIGDFNRRLSEEGSYETYFQTMLSKWGVKTPKELPDDKKKEFFDSVNSGWKSKDEVAEGASAERDPWGPDVVKQDPDRFKRKKAREDVLKKRGEQAAAFKVQQNKWAADAAARKAKGLPPDQSA